MPPPTIAGIEYVHMIDYYVVGFDPSLYKVRFHISDYTQHATFTNTLIGVGQAEPHRHPLSPNCVAQPPVIVEGVGRPILSDDGIPIDYTDGATIDLVYRPTTGFTGPTNILDDPDGHESIFNPGGEPILFCRQSLEFDTEVGTIPGSEHEYVWDGTFKKANIPLKYEVGITTMVLEFSRVRVIPIGLIRARHGKVNGPGGNLTSLINGGPLPGTDNPSGEFLGATRGHVLFRGARTTRGVSTDGTVERGVQLTFVERDHPWGTYMNRDTFEFDYVVTPSLHLKQYTEIDMRPLLQYLQPAV